MPGGSKGQRFTVLVAGFELLGAVLRSARHGFSRTAWSRLFSLIGRLRLARISFEVAWMELPEFQARVVVKEARR